METKLTMKGQTTVPLPVRKMLGINSGDRVEWEMAKGMVIISAKKKVADPVTFLTTQIKLNINAVNLVKQFYNRNFICG